MTETIYVQKMTLGSFKNVIHKICLEIIYLVYIFKKDLALNNQQWLLCHKTKQNKTKLSVSLLIQINKAKKNHARADKN